MINKEFLDGFNKMRDDVSINKSHDCISKSNLFFRYYLNSQI